MISHERLNKNDQRKSDYIVTDSSCESNFSSFELSDDEDYSEGIDFIPVSKKLSARANTKQTKSWKNDLSTHRVSGVSSSSSNKDILDPDIVYSHKDFEDPRPPLEILRETIPQIKYNECTSEFWILRKAVQYIKHLNLEDLSCKKIIESERQKQNVFLRQLLKLENCAKSECSLKDAGPKKSTVPDNLQEQTTIDCQNDRESCFKPIRTNIQVDLKEGLTTRPTVIHLSRNVSNSNESIKQKRKFKFQKEVSGRDLSAKKGYETPLETDGSYTCKHCKKSFLRERHFLRHKCLAKGDYVDSTKQIDGEQDPYLKQIKEDLDTDYSVDEDFENLSDADYEISTKEEGKTKEIYVFVHASEHDISDKYVKKEAVEDDSTDSRQFQMFGRKGPGRRRQKKASIGKRLVVVAEDTAYQLESSKDKEKGEASFDHGDSFAPDEPGLDDALQGDAQDNQNDVPIFSTNEERIAFEQQLRRVDLSVVDHLFSKQIINPSKAKSLGNALNKDFEYSCNFCQKAFVNINRIRRHCLVHTDLKPYRCPQCSLCFNARYMLLNHMRKHTGNFFRCSKCDFKTCHRPMLVRHQITHGSIRPVCKLCNSDLSCLRSLERHVKTQHADVAGREYLKTVKIKQSKLHECSMCHRRFASKLNRDRHQALHNSPQVEANSITCCLCLLSFSSRSHLQTHFLNHRLVYLCSICCQVYASAICLKIHLQEHLDDSVSVNQTSTTSEPSNTSGNLMLNSDAPISLSKEIDLESSGLISGSVRLVSGVEKSSIESVLANMISPPTQENVDLRNSELNHGLPEASEKTDHKLKSEPTHQSLEVLFQESVNKSWYIPESKQYASLEQISTVSSKDQSYRLSKLPADLSAIIIKNYEPLTEEVFSKILESQGDLECLHCGNRFHTKADLEGHILMNHFKKKPLKCSLCNYTGDSRENIKQHMRIEHKHEKFPCKDCDYVATSRNILYKHRKKHSLSRRKCPVCRMVLLNAEVLKSHMLREHPEIGENEVLKIVDSASTNKFNNRKCPYCSRSFTSLSMLKKHIWIHEGIRPFKCPFCKHRSRSRDNLNLHLLIHSSEKPFKCDVCSKSYRCKQALKLHHKTIHERLREFKCDRCDYVGKQLSHLQKHLRTHDREVYVCDKCDYKTMQKCYWKRHQEGHEGRPIYSCDRCDYNTTLQYYLKTHRETHNEKVLYSCDKCDYNATQKCHLKVHMEGHEGKLIYSCDKCDYVTVQKWHLKRHLASHEGTTFYRCDQCDYSAVQKNHLQRHLRTHERNIIYNCGNCDFSTDQRMEFRKHMADHSGKKLFFCDKCDFNSGQKWNLQKHEKIHDRGDSFVCNKCNFSTENKYNFKQHMEDHTTKVIYSCFKCTFTTDDRNGLKEHMVTHKGESLLFNCDKCGYSANKRFLYRKHMEMHEVLHCTKCDYSTSRKGLLKRHMEMHKLIRQVICQHCEYSCNTVKHMKAHYSRKHKDQVFDTSSISPEDYSSALHSIEGEPTVLVTVEQQDEKVYKCLSCSFIFERGSDLKQHLQAHHELSLDNVDFESEGGIQVEILTEGDVAAEEMVAEMTREEQRTKEATVIPETFQTIHMMEVEEGRASETSQVMEQDVLGSSQMAFQAVDSEGQLVALNPETIIVQEDGQKLVFDGENSYVIQYITDDPLVEETTEQ